MPPLQSEHICSFVHVVMFCVQNISCCFWMAPPNWYKFKCYDPPRKAVRCQLLCFVL
jgi:hypothetical protein